MINSKLHPGPYVLNPALRKNTLRNHCKGLSLKYISTQMCSDAVCCFTNILYPPPTRERPFWLPHWRHLIFQTDPPASPCLQNPISGTSFIIYAAGCNPRVPLQTLSYLHSPWRILLDDIQAQYIFKQKQLLSTHIVMKKNVLLER